MLKNISICHKNNDLFQKIEYNNFDTLQHKLKLLIINYDSDIFITLLINDNILNKFDIINMIILSKLNDLDTITIVFNQKKELYCLKNYNGKYILNWKNDNYSRLLKIIIDIYQNNSYNIIMNSSYKDIVLKAVKENCLALGYASTLLQNDREVILAAVIQNGYLLQYANILLQNDREIVLEAVKQNGYALQHTSNNFKNDKEIVLEAVKENGYALEFASSDLKNNKEIVLEAVKENGNALIFASINLQHDKEIISECS